MIFLEINEFLLESGMEKASKREDTEQTGCLSEVGMDGASVDSDAAIEERNEWFVRPRGRILNSLTYGFFELNTGFREMFGQLAHV